MSRILGQSITFTATAVLLIVVAGHQNANAAGPWYGAATGNDSDDCLGVARPRATINGALNESGFVPGDTIYVAVGTYCRGSDHRVRIL